MHHRPSVRVAAVAALAAGLALTGCTGDEPAPDPTSSSLTEDPTETPSQTASESGSDSPTESATDSPSPSGSPTGTQTGGVAEGFPTDVVPVLPDAVISVSTVSSANGVRSVSLSGSTTLPADQVLDFYRQALVAQGFAETAGGQAAGAPSSVFTRGGGAELLVVSVTTTGATQSFTVGGTIAGG